jgi:hypothetical protein
MIEPELVNTPHAKPSRSIENGRDGCGCERKCPYLEAGFDPAATCPAVCKSAVSGLESRCGVGGGGGKTAWGGTKGSCWKRYIRRWGRGRVIVGIGVEDLHEQVGVSEGSGYVYAVEIAVRHGGVFRVGGRAGYILRGVSVAASPPAIRSPDAEV